MLQNISDSSLHNDASTTFEHLQQTTGKMISDELSSLVQYLQSLFEFEKSVHFASPMSTGLK